MRMPIASNILVRYMAVCAAVFVALPAAHHACAQADAAAPALGRVSGPAMLRVLGEDTERDYPARMAAALRLRGPLPDEDYARLAAFLSTQPPDPTLSPEELSALKNDEEGIRSGDFVYTCNCGWLDSAHYEVFFARYVAIYNAMKAAAEGQIQFKSKVPMNPFFQPLRTYTWNLTGMALT